ncbi:paired amphipathic helix [Coprinopsis sp. MPI-PUGE-AT-0042]|nr:paired amphipathic helix [Coprinopsis sp. MPI-PUGE-AT-0042]
MTEPAANSSTSPSWPTGVAGPRISNSIEYINKVKIHFADQPQVYQQWLDIMGDFRVSAIGVPEVIERVSKLFNGNSELMEGFNAFLPPGHRPASDLAGNPGENVAGASSSIDKDLGV